MIANLVFLISLVCAHMEQKFPRIPLSRYNPDPNAPKDYDQAAPIGTQYHKAKPFCHRDMSSFPALDSFTHNTWFTAEFAGDAPHDGGHCEFALSYDGVNFAVIGTIISDCLANGARHHRVKIPEGAPSGTAVLAWTWVNRRGEREFYMNCAKVKIQGPKTGSVTGPKLLIVNLPGYPVIHQFVYSVKGVHHYRNRPSIVTGLDSNGKPTFKSISNQGAAKLPGRDYFYDPSHPDLDPTKGFQNYGKNEEFND